jgi:hypothetical protein
MMNSKKTIYILLPLAVVIWGFIIFRVMEQVDPDVEISGSVLPVPKFQGDSLQKKGFKLLLNYADPFLSNEVEREMDLIPEQNPNPESHKMRTWYWPNMQYGGCIQNKRKAVGILQLNSKNLLVQEGKVYDGYEVSKIYTDSIVMKREKEKRTVRKNY